MRDRATLSERTFEEFLSLHEILFERVKTGRRRTPDYHVFLGSVLVVFEVKEIVEDANFGVGRHQVSSRTVGEHIRKKINKAKSQISKCRSPAVLLIFNNLDPLGLFGTEDHDFRAAMQGEPQLEFDAESGVVNRLSRGLDSSLKSNRNTSFSAVGRLSKRGNEISVRLFENPHAKFPLLQKTIPNCIEYVPYNVTVLIP